MYNCAFSTGDRDALSLGISGVQAAFCNGPCCRWVPSSLPLLPAAKDIGQVEWERRGRRSSWHTPLGQAAPILAVC